MITGIIMSLIVILLAFLLMYGAKYQADSDHFFNKSNSNAMRGFWCLIIILVHVPVNYQNRIQDILGSFAYIGTTFFFMTSAFGLKRLVEKNSNYIKIFWRNRLPKLVIPCITVNVVMEIFNLFEKKSIRIIRLLWINEWVKWLLICYLIFWLIYRFNNSVKKDIIICILLVVFSLIIYFFKNTIIRTTWCSEIYGFIWGIILSNMKDKFSKHMNQRWILKCIIWGVLSCIVGFTYLNFKMIFFYGDYLLKIILGITIIIFILTLNIRIDIGNKASSFLGNISYEIYLLHRAVFGLISYIIPEIESGVFIIFSILMSTILAFLINRCSLLFERKVKKSEIAITNVRSEVYDSK